MNYQSQTPDNGFGMLPDDAPQGHSKGYSIAALVLGILAVILGCCCSCLYVIPLIVGILAIVFVFLARRDNGKKMTTMAIVALVLAIIGLVFTVVSIIIQSIIASMTFEEIEKLLGPDFFDNLRKAMGDEAYEEFIRSLQQAQ